MQWAVAFETGLSYLGLTQLGEIYVHLLQLMSIAVAHRERRY